VHNSKAVEKENVALMTENMSLRNAILKKFCFMCGGATVPAELLAENRRPLTENARLRDEYMRTTALLNQILLSAPRLSGHQSSPALPCCPSARGPAGAPTALLVCAGTRRLPWTSFCYSRPRGSRCGCPPRTERC
jgi:hypothetical protein